MLRDRGSGRAPSTLSVRKRIPVSSSESDHARAASSVLCSLLHPVRGGEHGE